MANKQKPCGKSFPFKTIPNTSTIPIKKNTHINSHRNEQKQRFKQIKKRFKVYCFLTKQQQTSKFFFHYFPQFSHQPNSTQQKKSTNLNDIVQANNIGVVNPLEDEDLRHERLLQFLVESTRSDFLDRHLGSMNSVPRVPHHRERPGPDLPTHQVVSDHSAPPCSLSHSRNSKYKP